MKPIYLPQNFYACGQTEDKNHNIEISGNFQEMFYSRAAFLHIFGISPMQNLFEVINPLSSLPLLYASKVNR